MGDKPLNRNRKTKEENRGFNGLLNEKPLNLEKKTKEKNYIEMGDETLGLKTSQSKQKHREEN